MVAAVTAGWVVAGGEAVEGPVVTLRSWSLKATEITDEHESDRPQRFMPTETTSPAETAPLYDSLSRIIMLLWRLVRRAFQTLALPGGSPKMSVMVHDVAGDGTTTWTPSWQPPLQLWTCSVTPAGILGPCVVAVDGMGTVEAVGGGTVVGGGVGGVVLGCVVVGGGGAVGWVGAEVVGDVVGESVGEAVGDTFTAGVGLGVGEPVWCEQAPGELSRSPSLSVAVVVSPTTQVLDKELQPQISSSPLVSSPNSNSSWRAGTAPEQSFEHVIWRQGSSGDGGVVGLGGGHQVP